MFYRWGPADLDAMDWADALAFHAAAERMTRAAAEERERAARG